MSMTVIKSVDPRSPARRAGVRAGETLTHINGHQIVDVLDYKFYSYDPKLELTLNGADGSTRTLRVRKMEGEDLGLEFEMCNLSDNAPLSAFEVFLKRNLLETDYPLDGLFCGTDLMAYQTVKMVRSLGKRVPEDVQIIGYDGMRMFGDKDYICSTIVQPVAEMAETAVKMVLSPDYRGLPQLICLPVRYQPGGTTREPVEETV